MIDFKQYKWVNKDIIENDPENYFIDAMRYVSVPPSKNHKHNSKNKNQSYDKLRAIRPRKS